MIPITSDAKCGIQEANIFFVRYKTKIKKATLRYQG